MKRRRREGEKGGAKRIDLMFRGVGRVHVTAQTTNQREYERRKDGIKQLYREGAIEALCMLRDGKISVVELLAVYRGSGATSRLALVQWQNVWDVVDELAGSLGKSAETQARYATTFKKLKACGVIPATARIADLERVDWRKVRPHFGGAADWNHLHRAVSKLLSEHLGDMLHPFRRAVVKRIVKEPEPERVPEVTLEQFWKAHALLPVWARDAVLLLALTGVRIGEYIHATADDLRPASLEWAVDGKSGKRVVSIPAQAWPLVAAAIPARYAPPVKPGQRNSSSQRYQRLQAAWQKATTAAGIVCTLHDCRHLHAQIASDKGFSDGSIADRLGHAQVATTRRYAKQTGNRAVADAVADEVLRKIG